MNDLAYYYTPVDREIFVLLDHFVALVHEFEGRGAKDADAKMKLEELGKLRELVDIRAEQRRKFAEEQEETERKEMESRTRIPCPTCKTEQQVKITGEKYVNPPGVTYDLAECPTCGTTFMAGVPNTTKDKLRLGDHMVEMLTIIESDGKKTPELDEQERQLMLLMGSLREMRKADYAAKEQAKINEQSRAKADKQLVDTRDLLLLWKLKAANPGGGGMA